ncbi:hypothetical protein [Calidithermus timidus]|jgi:hypothetical protein|uniref:hypothetical protein n=1 Tax=Calidithermus timidus TaxID=307124 RepID=UPI0003A1E5FA|nr:hypothetical protein [Calidithermus timidus]
MQLDDLLGLLFLFFFVILPALRGLLRRGENTFDIPDIDELPNEPDHPASAQPRPAQSTPQPQPTQPPAPSSPPPKAQPRPAQPRPQRKEADPFRERARLAASEEQVRRKLSELERRLSQAQPKAAKPAPQEPAQQPMKKPPAFGTDSQAILNGIVWSEILKEPKGRSYLNKRNPRFDVKSLVKER